MIRTSVLAALLLSMSAPAAPVTAQSPEMQAATTTAFERRAAQLVALLNGEIAFADYFDPSFQAALPEAQFKAMTAGLIAQYGLPIAVEKPASSAIGVAVAAV